MYGRRTTMQGPPTAGGFLAAIPPVIRVIMFTCTGVWLLQLMTMGSARADAAWIYLKLVAPWLVERGYVWQLVTYQFLHSPLKIGHLLFNMYSLWLFGRELEGLWGRRSFLQFYLACGVGAGLVHVLLSLTVAPQEAGVVIGASGAVMGLMVAFAMRWPDRQLLMMFVFPMTARNMVIIFALLELLFAWIPQNGIANLAHLGGMATAWLYLRHGWRVAQIGGLGGKASGAVSGWRRRRRMKKMHLVEDDPAWEEWLKRELDDDNDTRH